MAREYMERLFDKELDFYLRSVGAVQIVGPKWCGKSTTARRHAASVIDLLKKSDREQFIPLAKEAPGVFLSYGKKPLLIDEWQIISFIWNSLKEHIDENGRFGQFILTGSVTDRSIEDFDGEGERHTGTGRIIKRMMRTFSLFESRDSSGLVSLSGLKDGIFSPGFSSKDLHDYAFFLCRGGWPLAIGQSDDVALQQARTFYDGLVNEDLFSLADVPLRKDASRARRLLRSYSRFIASDASNERIKFDLSRNGDEIGKDTFSKYLLALERLFVIEELESWNPNLRSKTAIRVRNTRHFVDPSIATAALNLTPDGLFLDMNTFGLLFESLAIRDLRIYADSIGANVYHYRDKNGREADAVIVFPDGSWALAEVKLTNLADIVSASGKLRKLADDIDIVDHPKPSFLMVLTAGRTAYRDENGVYVAPLACLRN